MQASTRDALNATDIDTTTLTITNDTSLTSDDLREIALKIRQSFMLDAVTIAGCALSAEQLVKFIVPEIKKHPSITKVSFAGNGVEVLTGEYKLLRTIIDNPRIHTIDLIQYNNAQLPGIASWCMAASAIFGIPRLNPDVAMSRFLQKHDTVVDLKLSLPFSEDELRYYPPKNLLLCEFYDTYERRYSNGEKNRDFALKVLKDIDENKLGSYSADDIKRLNDRLPLILYCAGENRGDVMRQLAIAQSHLRNCTAINVSGLSS